MPINGLVTMTPTSIASTGTGNSSSINTNGSVTFSTCATLSLNGVFTSSYDNYMVTMRSSGSTGGVSLRARLRASGTDASSSTYTDQLLQVDSTTIGAARTSTASQWNVHVASNVSKEGMTLYLFGPNLAQATAFRSVTVAQTPELREYAGTHSLSTSYDGITFIPGSGSFTGLVTVYGFNQ